MKIIGIDGFEVYVKFGKQEFSSLVKRIAMLDDDRTKDDS